MARRIWAFARIILLGAVIFSAPHSARSQGVDDVLTPDQVEAADADQIETIGTLRRETDQKFVQALQALALGECERFETIRRTSWEDFYISSAAMQIYIGKFATLRRSQVAAIKAYYESRMLELTRFDCPPPRGAARRVATAQQFRSGAANDLAQLRTLISRLQGECDQAKFERNKSLLLQGIDKRIADSQGQLPRPEDPALAKAIADQIA